MRTEQSHGRSTALWLHVLLPVTVVAIGYGATLDDFFLADDVSLLANARGAADWSDATALSPRWNLQFHRPLTLASWWLATRLFGLDPVGHHLVNLALHGLNACLLARLVARLARSTAGGAVAGAAFAALPMHAEAVTWISGRFDVACASGVLVALLAWTRWLEGGGPRALAAAALGLALAAASKEPGFLLLGYLPLLALARGRLDARARRGLLLPALVAAALLAWRVRHVGGLGGVLSKDGERNRHLDVDLRQLWRYLHDAAAACFLPTERAARIGLGHPWRLLPVLAWVGALAVTLRDPARQPTLRLAAGLAAMFLLSLAPTITWAHVGAQYQATRFLYVPSVFSAALLGVLFASVRGTRARIVAAILAAAAVGSWTHQLRAENRRFGAAAELAERALAAFPLERIDGRTALVVDAPDSLDGVAVFHGALPVAVALLLDPDQRVREVPPEAWERRLSDDRHALLRWRPEEERWELAPLRQQGSASER